MTFEIAAIPIHLSFRGGQEMHFFYLDESGCSGADLAGVQEPIFVLGGISVRDEGWRKTFSEFQKLISNFFNGNIPEGFELHASELLSPNGDGHYAGRSRDERNALATNVLDLLADRGHDIHFVGLDKAKIRANATGQENGSFDTRVPYLLAYNYLVSYVERFCKEKLGRSARGMIIVDPKDQFEADIEKIIHYRRYKAASSAALKWVVEFSYAIDSERHPMIQMSDLVIFLARKFLEVENGYRDEWPAPAKNFYAKCYDKILQRVAWKDVIPYNGKAEKGCHELVGLVRATHRQRWRVHYDV